MQQSGRQAKLLKDYSPPDYLIEEVELDVSLEPKAARVASKLRLRPNPKVATGGRRSCSTARPSGSKAVALDGKPLSAERLCAQRDLALHRRGSGQAFHPRDRHAAATRTPTPRSWAFIARAAPIAPNASRRAFAASPIFSTGPTCSPSTPCASRPTAPRPRCCCPTAIRVAARRARRHRPPLRRLARSLPQAVLSVRAGRRAISAAFTDSFVTASGPQRRARASMSSTATRTARLCDGRR